LPPLLKKPSIAVCILRIVDFTTTICFNVIVMARLLDEHAAVTFENRDQAPKHSLEKGALDAVRDAILAGDKGSLDEVREGRLPEGWNPGFSEHLGAMVAKITAWNEQRAPTESRPGDSVGFVGLGAFSARLEAEQATTGDEGFNHGRINIALRFVLKSIADREQREAAARTAETQVLPASLAESAPVSSGVDANTAAFPINGGNTRPLTLEALTRVGATRVGNTPTTIIPTTNFADLRPVSPAAGS
jgi:hypothetical protein